ncbi:MAG: cytochrome c [Nitrospirota bacterium]
MNRKRMKTALFIIVVISILSYLNITLMAESKKENKKAKSATSQEEGYTALDAWKGKEAEAKSNYMMYCSPCHGENGRGNGPQAEAMEVPPRNHTDGNYLSTRSDEQLFKVVKEGGPAIGFSRSMPPFDYTLTEDEIKGVVKYVRTLCNCGYKKAGVAK